MNKTEIESSNDVFLYLHEHFNECVKAKKNRGGKNLVNLERLHQLNEILEEGFNIDISYFFLDPNNRRHRHLVYLRYICFNFLRENYTLQNISKMLNRYDHTTVINGLEQYEQLCSFPDMVFKPFNDQFNRVKDELGY